MSADLRLGAYLRRYRERAGLSVEALSAASRIVPRLLRALEEDRHDVLPAPVYVRGFIRSYCAEVGAPADEALALYEAARPRRVPAALASMATPPVSVARARGGRVRVATALALAGLALAGTGIAVRGGRRPDPAGGTAAAGSPATPARPGAAGPPASTAPVEHVLVLRATEAAWVRVAPADGGATEEVLAPGAVREWRSTGPFRVTLGNAGGVALELDGRALPALGTRGDVVRDVVIPGGSGR